MQQVLAQGGLGVLAFVLLVILRELWADNKALRAQNREDLQKILPALTEATTATTEFTKAAAAWVAGRRGD